ncbi:MAG: spore germination protein [Clostridiales bacterium]|jgi:spore germination protein|nr:spore germination protein [Clostridiales bacterium]
MLSASLDENIKELEDMFADCGDLVHRKFPVGENKDIWLYVAYIDMLVNRDTLENQVINQLMVFSWQTPPKPEALSGDPLSALIDSGVTTADISKVNNLQAAADAILSGDTILMADGSASVLTISTKGWPSRGISSTENEVVVQGSKDAFSESFRMNTMLIRRRIKDTKLKCKQLVVGERSKSSVALMYLEDLTRPSILNEALRRVQSIDIDGILDIGYIEQLTEDDWKSPFPMAQITERPDKASAAILEGRIVIVTDNSPFVMIIPATLNTFFQASEDYYQGWQIMSFVRLLRFAAGIMAVALPGLYIAVAVYHPSMIPLLLLFKMAGARQAVPFPAVFEILLMDLAFELLREAGIRLPRPVGNAIGVVGGLIIGQSAVEAGLVSPFVLIIVALTAIAGFAIPHIKLVNSFRLIKYIILCFSSMLGLLGFWIGTLLVLIHLVSLKSYGFPYLFPFVSGDVNGYSDMKDTLFRAPLFNMKKRPIFARPDHSERIHTSKPNAAAKE